MMMTKKEIVKILFDMLTSDLEAYGYMPNIKEQMFIKRQDAEICIYSMIILDRTLFMKGGTTRKGYEVVPYVRVVLNDITKYYKQVTFNKDLKKDIDFFTIGNNIATILANPDGIYKKRNESLDLLITEDAHLKDTAIKLLRYFKEVAEPFCRKNASIARVDELLNSRPSESKLEAANDIYRMINGMIAAKLNNNPKLEELISIYERQMIEWNMEESFQEEFAKVKGLLFDTK